MKMKKAKFLVPVVVAVAMMINIGCSKSNPLNPLDGCSGNASWVEAISNESTAYANAVMAYSDDPSEANCANQKTAGKNYLDALGEVAKCVPTVSQAQYNEAIAEAKKDIDEANCDG